MEENKVIVYGNFYNIVRVFNNCPKLYSYIYLHITDNEKMPDGFVDIPSCTMDILEDNSYKNFLIVISDDNCFEEVTNILYKKYNINPNNCIRMRFWLSKMLREHGDVLLIPKQVNLDVCTMCQLNCRDCYMRRDNSGVLGAGYTKFSDFKNLIDKNPFIRKMDIGCNGEIFLNPDLEKILNYCHEKDIIITMDGGTNFNNVSDKLLETLVTSQVFSICISLDGATNEIYQKYRVNGNLNNVLSNIRKLNYYKEKYNSKFPYLTCQFIIMEDNVHQVEDIAKLAKDYKMSLLYKKEWSNSFVPHNKEYLEQITGLDYSNEKINNLGFCYQMILTPQINWDGRVLGCCVVYRDDWKKNVFEDGLISALNSNIYRDGICNLLEGGVNKNLKNPCIDCNSLVYDNINMNI